MAQTEKGGEIADDDETARNHRVKTRSREYVIGLMVKDQIVEQAVRLAISEINASPSYLQGDTLRLIVAQSLCSASSGLLAGQTLAAAGVVAVIGGECSVSTKAAYGVLNSTGIPMFTYASTSLFFSDTKVYPRLRQICYNDKYIAQGFMKTIENFGWQLVGMIYSDEPYGAGLADEMTRLTKNSSVVIGEKVKFNHGESAQMLAPMLASLNSSNVRVVVVLALPSDTQSVIQAANIAGIIGRGFVYVFSELSSAIVVDGFPTAEMELLQRVAYGSLGIQHSFERSEVFTKFENSIREAFSGTSIDRWSPYAYDAVYAVARGIAAVKRDGLNLDGDTLISNISPFFGSSGEINLNQAPTPVLELQNFQLNVGVVIGTIRGPAVSIDIGAKFNGTAPSAKVFKLGYVYSAIDLNGLYGGMLALDELNALAFLGDGDVLSMDGLTRASGCSASSGQAIAHDFISKQVIAIIGGYCSDETLAMLQITQASADPIPSISYISTSAKLASAASYPYFLRTVYSDDLVNFANAAAIDLFGFKLVGLYSTDDSYAGGSANMTQTLLLSRGVTISVNERWTRGTAAKDIVSKVKLIKDWKLKVVIVISHVDSFNQFCLALSMSGVKPGSITILHGNPSVLPSANLDATTGFLPGLLASVPKNSVSANRKDFARRYAQRYPLSVYSKSDPESMITLASFDAVTAVAKALKLAKSDGMSPNGKILMSYLRSLNFEGVSANISWVPGTNDITTTDPEAFAIANIVGMNNSMPVLRSVGYTGVTRLTPARLYPSSGGGSVPVLFGQGLDACPLSCLDGFRGYKAGCDATGLMETVGAGDNVTAAICYTCAPCESNYTASKDQTSCVLFDSATLFSPLGGPLALPKSELFSSPRVVEKLVATTSLYGSTDAIFNGFVIAVALLVLTVVAFVFITTRLLPASVPFISRVNRFTRHRDNFSMRHVQPLDYPVVARRTLLGGVFGLVFWCMSTLAVTYLIIVFTLDSIALDYFSNLGLSKFSPKSFVLHLTVRARLVDNPRACYQACLYYDKVEWDSGLNVHNVSCELDPALAECSFKFQISPANTKSYPTQSWLRLNLSARVYAFQYNLTSTWMGRVFYVSGNVTGGDSMLMGREASSTILQLKPTTYYPLRSDPHSGFGVFEISSTEGSVVDYEIYFKAGLDSSSTSATYQIYFQRPDETDEFREREKRDYAALVSKLVSVTTGLYGILAFLLRRLELLLCRSRNRDIFDDYLDEFAKGGKRKRSLTVDGGTERGSDGTDSSLSNDWDGDVDVKNYAMC